MKLIQQNEEILNTLFFWHQDTEMAKRLGFPSVELEYNAFIEMLENKYDGQSNYIIGVLANDGLFHGFYFVESSESNRRAKVHFGFDSLGRGKLLRTSVKSFYDYMFRERGYNSLYGEISVTNNKSYNCAKRMGWKDLCILPNYFNEHGDVVDVHLLMLTEEMRKI